MIAQIKSEMDSLIDHLISDCDAALQIINSQKLSNVYYLGENVLNYGEALEAANKMRYQDLVEIKCLRNPFQIVRVIFELYRILNIQDIQEIELLELEKFTYENKEFVVPKPYKVEGAIPISTTFLQDLHNLDIFSVKDYAIKHLNKFDLSENGPITQKYLSRYSSFASKLVKFFIQMKSFCQKLNQVKPHLNFTYDSISKNIENLDSYLKENKTQEVESKDLNKSKVELQIQKVLQTVKNKLKIDTVRSSFISFILLNTDFKNWINNKRPLAYWYSIDNQSIKKKVQELTGYYLYQKEEEIIEPYQVGFDFLLILKDEEIKQIQHLEIDTVDSEDAKFMVGNLQLLNRMQLKSLNINHSILSTVWKSKEYTQNLNDFLNSQKEIEEFTLVYDFFDNREALFEIICRLPQYSNLTKLNLNIDYQFSVEQINKINQSFLSFKKLEYLSFGFSLNDINLNANSISDLQFPSTLKVLNLSFDQNFRILFQKILYHLSSLTELHGLTISLRTEMERDNVPLLNELLKVMKSLCINKLELKFQYQDTYYQKFALLGFLKLKKLVNLQIYPNLKEQFQLEQ